VKIQRAIFSAGVWSVACGFVARDRCLGRIKRGSGMGRLERVKIASGHRRLDAVFAPPEVPGNPHPTAVLICHGIGETVEHWERAQQRLASHGIASLVFNYSGCGRSTGRLSAEHCERDAVAAFWWLREKIPEVPVTLLGFSLGSGVATTVMGKIPIAGMVLCEAYCSFREAMRHAGLPLWLAAMVPDVWPSEETLATCKLPVLVVHGERDKLFPVEMGRRLARAAGEQGTFASIPEMGHADLHAEDRTSDWQYLVEWLQRASIKTEIGEIKA
jgi:alpha-beta hydrolase superfamily lysophospholipase